jgi:flagellar biosynthetic protein FliP
VRPQAILAKALLGCTVMALHASAGAQTAGQLPLLVGAGGSNMSFSVPVQTLLFFTALSFLPAVLLMMTGFTRIVIVLSLLRQALGTQSSPPNQVIVGLSLFLTFFVMGPTLDRIYADAYLPLTKNTITFEQALEKGEAPIRGFGEQTRQSIFLLAKL